MVQTVRFGNKKDDNIINIDDVVEDESKIYCNHKGSRLLFLTHIRSRYIWHGLTASNIFSDGVTSLRQALENADTSPTGDSKVLIFDSQCEVFEYAKKMYPLPS